MAQRKRVKNLDEVYMGSEPDFRDTPPPTDENERQAVRMKASRWYSYFTNKKLYAQRVHNYCQHTLGFSKKEMQAIKKCPDWKLYMGQKGHFFVRMTERGWNFEEESINESHTFLRECMEEGKKLLKEVKEKKDLKPKAPVISPQERTRRKVLNTIVGDWDEMVVDKWMDGIFDKKQITFPVYSLFQMHGLKGGPAINMFKEHVQFEYDSVKGAYDKTDEQLVEGYSHIKKGDQRKMLDFMDKIFEECERVRDAQRNARIRTKTPRSRDKQVEKLNYLKDSEEAKIASINPVLIPGANYLWMYNVKQKKLTEFMTSSSNGFEVRGSTLYNWEKGRVATLRKPDEILPQILNKTVKQIDKIWDGLTTKIGKPTGRINKDCVILRRELWKN